MAAKHKLNEEENRAMRVLWDKGSASASELASAMSGPQLAGPKVMDHALALNLLRRLKAKGAVSRRRMGSNITYHPNLNQHTAPMHALGRLLANPEGGNTNGLGFVVMLDSHFDPSDLADLKAEREERAASKGR